MPVYLGSLGRMVKLPYVTSQSVEAEERYSFQPTLEGVRKAQVKPVGRRTWALATQHFRPSEHATLSQFANGAWGNGPFVFISADAPITNMLTPAASLCMDLWQSGSTDAGPVDLGDEGWAARSIKRSEGSEIHFQFERTPIMPGVPVSGAAHVQGAGAMVRLYWTDDSSAVIGAASSDPAVGSSWQKLSVTAVPPANATGVRLIAQNATRVTRPVLTWTGTAQVWSEGQGCPKAIVHAVSREQVNAVPGHTYSNLGFTISEVG